VEGKSGASFGSCVGIGLDRLCWLKNAFDQVANASPRRASIEAPIIELERAFETDLFPQVFLGQHHS